MCTVTFIARQNGYALGMNRDEQLTRVPGLPPQKLRLNGRTVICPSEPGGGSWIALNDAGVTFALINWYAVTARINQRSVSRGRVVNAVSPVDSADAATKTLRRLPLARLKPFRLMGIFPPTRETIEWRWDSKELIQQVHPWETRQWSSSGFDEPTAQRIRGRTFGLARAHEATDSLAWLRRLHGSHSPTPGPFSICMHREDAATVSYTEVSVWSAHATMRYHPGSPCRRSPFPPHLLRLRDRLETRTHAAFPG